MQQGSLHYFLSPSRKKTTSNTNVVDLTGDENDGEKQEPPAPERPVKKPRVAQDDGSNEISLVGDEQTNSGSEAVGATVGTSQASVHTSAASAEVKPSTATVSHNSIPRDRRDAQQDWDTLLEEFDPCRQAEAFSIQPGSRCPYAMLASVFAAVDSTTKRLAIIRMMANFFRVQLAYTPKDVLPALYLFTNQIAPSFEGVELGIGGSLVVSVLCEVAGVKRKKVQELYRSLGDLGDVAATCVKSQQTLVKLPDLTVSGIHEMLLQISEQTGEGSASRKRSIVGKLLRAAKGTEQIRYIMRILVGNLRIGASVLTVLQALGNGAFVHEVYGIKTLGTTESKLKSELEQVYKDVKFSFSICSSLRTVAEIIVDKGVSQLRKCCTVHMGVPVQPMLAKACSKSSEAVEHFNSVAHKGKSSGPFLVEYKYDGQRAQIHYSGSHGAGCSRVYSRHLEDCTERWPDVREVMDRIAKSSSELPSGIAHRFGEKTESFILDVEVVAVEKGETGRILPFQTLSSRNRKEVNVDDVNVNVCVCAFDLLYLNGQDLLRLPLWTRRLLLLSYFPVIKGKFIVTDGVVVSPNDSECAKIIDEWINGAASDSCEGVICKCLGHCGAYSSALMSLSSGISPGGQDLLEKATTQIEDGTFKPKLLLQKHLEASDTSAEAGDYSLYVPSERSDTWLKLKRDYVDELADSLDLVPIGAWYGNGRKAGWYSPVLLGCYDEEFQKWQSVCRCMSGFSDAFYKWMKEFYSGDNLLNVSEGRIPEQYETTERPPLWFKPCQVWEIRAAEFTLSSVHRAASHLLEEEEASNKGIACRFPRFYRIREDKTPEEATTGKEQRMYDS
eukprot:gb/GECG01009769.1/.p1 GENE.gb/GECG01009769.1/~~gb/GECG01009769.1/.p1  ORF type:complete len:841 (+),score=104.87 gb/GECG01009769.1/:1-2523(+)